MGSEERSERNQPYRGSKDRRQRRVLQETLQEPVERPKQRGRPRQRKKAEHKAKHRFSAALVEVARVAISLDQIKQLTRNPRQEYADAFSEPSAAEALAVYGILDNPLRLCHFLAQVMTETRALKTLSENLDYSATRLMEVWPRHFRTMQQAEAYAHNPEKLGNFIYGETSIAQALGNNQPGDGFKYRGRGLLQITGRGAYTRYGDKLGIDLVNDPDLAFSPGHCLSVAGVEWAASGFHGKTCNELADQDNLEGVTYAINGGQNGIDDRRLWLRRAKSIWFPERAIAEAVFPNLPFGDLAVASRGVANIAAEVPLEAAGDFAGRSV
jgi:predicted chitinase